MSDVASDEIGAAVAAIGRCEVWGQLLDIESLRRFSLAIGGNGEVIDAHPALAHWAWFLPSPADGEIGPDGHPSRGGFLPALGSLPRRMFASSSIDFEAPLLLDHWAEMTSRISDVRHRTGRSGELVFVEVERQVHQSGTRRVVERQTLVYRAATESEPAPLPIPVDDASPKFAGVEIWTPGTVNLFRFSSVTFNGHRIHYDLPYARDVEGYPSLIVQGPFIAARLAEVAARAGGLSGFEFRAQVPCFVDQAIRLRPSDEGFEAVRCDGAVATSAKASYR